MLKLVGNIIIATLTGSGYGLVVSTFIPSIELIMSLIPVILIPMMLFSGFFVSQDKIPYYFYEFKYTSFFKYPYQTAVRVIYCPSGMIQSLI